jgi:hypothetical protein
MISFIVDHRDSISCEWLRLTLFCLIAESFTNNSSVFQPFLLVQAALPQGIVPFVFAREYNLHPDILSTA